MVKARSPLVREVAEFIALAAVLFLIPAMSPAQGRSGAVYVLTNQHSGNAVMVFQRAPDGTLTLSGTFATGGTGAGTGADPLGSQGALVLGRGHRLLFAINAGSNSVSVFAVEGLKLQLLGTTPSGGTMPVSVAVHGPLVYVLNAGGTPNITGFLIDPFGRGLIPLPGSSRSLAGGTMAGPAEVSFSPDGAVLMVTEKSDNKIDTYVVHFNGYASPPNVFPSNGATPFGFTFVHGGYAVVSEAGPGALASYQVYNNGNLQMVTSSVADSQLTACWAVATRDGRYAYTANAGSNSISSYSISRFGELSLLNPTAGLTGDGSVPTDMAFSDDSRFLYVREGGTNTVGGFSVGADGSLTPIGSVDGIPSGAQGIAAR
jgi:6-phosphogluconolactonase